MLPVTAGQRRCGRRPGSSACRTRARLQELEHLQQVARAAAGRQRVGVADLGRPGWAARAPAQRVAAVHAQRLAFLRGARTGRRGWQGAWHGFYGPPAAACGTRRRRGPAACGVSMDGVRHTAAGCVRRRTIGARGGRSASSTSCGAPAAPAPRAAPGPAAALFATLAGFSAAHHWSWRPLSRPRAGQRRTGGHLGVRGAGRRGGRPLGIGVGDQQRRHGAEARGLGHAGQDARGLQAALLRRGGKRVWPPAVVTLQMRRHVTARLCAALGPRARPHLPAVAAVAVAAAARAAPALQLVDLRARTPLGGRARQGPRRAAERARTASTSSP